jgi:tetratricopeptide (TPR) repeat protein
MIKKTSIFLIVVLGFVLYFNSFFNGFVWDDEEQVVLNTNVHSIANIPSLFTQATFNSGGAAKMGGLYYRPLMTTAFTLIYSIFGSGAFFFHFFQVALHIASAIFLFLILNHFLKKENLSLLLSLVFLVHPINSETVLYISGLQDALFFFFGALSFWIIISKDDLKDLLLSSFLLFLSVASKETGAVWWIVITVFIFIYKRYNFKAHTLFLVFWAALYSFLRFGIAKIYFAKHGLTEISKMNFLQRLMNLPAVAFYYLKTFVWPLNIAVEQQWLVKEISFTNFYLPLAVFLVFLAILLFGAWYLYKKKDKYFTFYLIFLIGFLLSFAMHLQFFPLDMTVSDRFFYLPEAFLLGLAGVFLARIKKDNAVTWIAVVLIILFSVRTFIRTFDWRNGLTLYSHDINISQSFDLVNNLGVELYRKGDIEGSRVYFEKSIQMSPNWWTNYNNLGAYYEAKGDLPKAQELYLTAIKNGNYYLAVENYAKVLYKEGKYSDLKSFLLKYLPYFPDNQTLLQLWQLMNYPAQ